MTGTLLRGLLWALCASLLCHSSLQAQTRFPLLPESPERIQLEATLNQRITCNYIDAPFAEVMDDLSRRYQFSFYIYARNLADEGIDAKATAITADCHNRRLRDFLTDMLSDLSLAWVVEGEIIHITIPEDAEGRLQTVIYPFADLLRWHQPRRAGDPATPGFDSIIELITSTLSPNSWDEFGGPGSISGDEHSLSLVVSQTYEVQEEVHNLLNTLRQVKQHQQHLPSSATHWHPYTQLQTPVASRRGSSSVSLAKLSPARSVSSSRSSARSLPTSSAPLQSWQQPQIYSQ